MTFAIACTIASTAEAHWEEYVEMTQSVATQEPTADDIRAHLHAIAEASADVLSALDAAGVHPETRPSSRFSLHALDRRLPRRSVHDLLLACETFAAVTGPTLLSSEKLRELHAQAQSLLQVVHVVELVTREATQVGASGTTMHLGGLLLRAALATSEAQDALTRLAYHLGALSAEPEGRAAARRFEVRIGTRFLVPGSVIGLTLVLILFFLSGIAFATGAVSLSSTGVAFSKLQGGAATQTATSSAHPGSATQTANQPQSTPAGRHATPTALPTIPSARATATPYGHATPTSLPPTPPATPTLSVAPSVVNPCVDVDKQFTVNYTGGAQVTNWTVTSSDPSTIGVSLDGVTFASSVNGSLSPDGSRTIYVRLLRDIPTSGTLSVSGSGGVSGATVRYDSTTC